MKKPAMALLLHFAAAIAVLFGVASSLAGGRHPDNSLPIMVLDQAGGVRSTWQHLPGNQVEAGAVGVYETGIDEPGERACG